MITDYTVILPLAVCLVPLFQQNQRGALLFLALMAVCLL
jgi:hypothetical protein